MVLRRLYMYWSRGLKKYGHKYGHITEKAQAHPDVFLHQLVTVYAAKTNRSSMYYQLGELVVFGMSIHLRIEDGDGAWHER